MKKVLLLGLVALMSFSACQKQDANVNPKTSTRSSAVAQAMSVGMTINPSNPNDPYDSLGYHHNHLLDYYFQEGLNAQTPEDSLIVWNSNYAAQYFGVNNFETIENSDSFKYGFSKRNETLSANDYINDVNADYNSGLISNDARNTLVQIINVVNSESDSLSTNTQIQAVINAVNSIENNVIASTMSDNDKYYVLSQSAVLTYSLSYWYQNGGAANNNTTYSSNSVHHLTKADLSAIAFADARGAQMAVSTGAAEWGTLFGGAAGGVAVVVAYAATFSGSAYYVITHH